MTATAQLPGRLGDPGMTLGTDPRADQRMVAEMKRLGLADNTAPPPIPLDAPLDEVLSQIGPFEAGYIDLFGPSYDDLAPIEGVKHRTEVIAGGDGSELKLYIHTPPGAGPWPGVLHIHGGGMVILTAADVNYTRWRDELAALGLVVVGVEFRNAAGRLGAHPFPAALDDCALALDWVHANLTELAMSRIVVSGESGGGNLSLATTLRAAREGRLHMIDGVYAQCPYISGAYADPPADLASLRENDGYLLDNETMAMMVRLYDPGGDNARNPLAWPMWVDESELEGMPPHAISLNELDPLRDEGLAYYRKLLSAGVPTVGRTVNGTCHAGDVIFRSAIADVYAASARDLANFASSC